MNFDVLDKEMRIYEQSLDQYILPELYLVVRLDGRSFTKLTKETCNFEAPFDEKFRDLMIETTKAVMECGFTVVYGYTESDEISLLFGKNCDTFSRKTRKINSILAGEASVAFSMAAGVRGTFDCRVVPLPNIQRVKDYFLWRQEDAHRNSLNSWCYWTLRKEGLSKNKATAMLLGKSVSFKNELLFERGINYNNLPLWQKRGVGFYYEDFEKEGFDPVKQEKTMTMRRAIKVDLDIPTGEEYANLIGNLLEKDRGKQ